jgi:hypothetical protein
MRFYAEERGLIPEEDLEMFGRILRLIQELPDIVFDPSAPEFEGCGNQLSCHLLCRALVDHFEVTAHDGYFLAGYHHSWLLTRDGQSLIDVYPVAGVMPFIVHAMWPSPWLRVYTESDNLNEMFVSPEFLERLEVTRQSISETLSQTGVPSTL